MRDEEPVCWTPEKDDSGFWSITRYQDVIEANHRWDEFSSKNGIRLEEMDPDEIEARRTMMELDPPHHTRLRRLVNRGFTRQTVETFEEPIRNLATEIIERALEKTEFDFVDEVARILPMRMLGRLLGVPDEDGELLVDLGDQLLSNSDPEYTDHVVDKVNTEEFRLIPFRSPAGLEVFKYAQNAASERRNSQHQDLITRLLEPTNDGQPLTDLEFNNFFTLLVAAGNDTTRYSLTEGLRALVEHPDEMQKLRDDPKLIESAIEEILRWTTVTTHFRRTATSDLELSGHEIKEGQKVVLWWISANYDERKFEDPYKFDICRHPNDHVTFGRNGPHLCLGAWLARMELRVTIQELLKRTSKIEITKTSEKLRSHLISGTKHLFVKAT
ncbi:MAG: cytochrome P450 [Acidimicrobiaceae bacterium]|nr:cytochrome P450 [Acidimicrobiaceae bacterium]